jgi:hypothetical protein
LPRNRAAIPGTARIAFDLVTPSRVEEPEPVVRCTRFVEQTRRFS